MYKFMRRLLLFPLQAVFGFEVRLTRDILALGFNVAVTQHLWRVPK